MEFRLSLHDVNLTVPPTNVESNIIQFAHMKTLLRRLTPALPLLWLLSPTVALAGDGEEGFIHQALARLPEFGGNRPVSGVWMIDREAAGLGIRENTRRITGNWSRFVPHFFQP